MIRLTLLGVCLLFGSKMSGAIEPISVVSAAAAVVSAGSSLAGTTMSGLMSGGYSVTCGIEVENWTRFTLVLPEVRVAGGQLKIPPRPILPSKREAMVAHKTAYVSAGSYGTVSWLVKGKARRVYIMWSAPFNFNHYSNWLAVGISKVGSTQHPHGDSTFSLMYYDEPGTSSYLGFDRREFWSTITPVLYKDNEIEITGTMGTTHKALVKVFVRPVKNRDLATNIRALMQIE